MNLFTEKISKYLVWTGICIVLVGLLLFIYKESLFQFDTEIKADKIAQLGDFIGGIVGSLWA